MPRPTKLIWYDRRSNASEPKPEPEPTEPDPSRPRPVQPPLKRKTEDPPERPAAEIVTAVYGPGIEPPPPPKRGPGRPFGYRKPKPPAEPPPPPELKAQELPINVRPLPGKRKRATDAIPELDSFEDVPVFDNGTVSDLTFPVRKMTPLCYEPGRGMVAPTGENDPVYAKFLERLPLEDLKFALAKDNSPRALEFLSDLVNPHLAKVNIATLAKRRSIGLPDMMQIWRNHNLAESMQTLIEGSPALSADVVIDARSVYVCCARCDGAGTVRVKREAGLVWINCPHCLGEGTVRRPGDAKSRDTVFRSIGFIRPDGGVSVNINNTSAPSVSSVLEELERLEPAIPVTASIPDNDS